MVLGVISSEGDVMPPHIFLEDLNINADAYIYVLQTAVKPWMDKTAARRDYVFQQDSAAAHKARKTQAWLHANVPYHWSLDLWPPSSPNCNPLDYYFWGVVEEKVNKVSYNTKDAFKDAMIKVMTNMPKEEVKRACSKFRSKLEKVIAPDGGYITVILQPTADYHKLPLFYYIPTKIYLLLLYFGKFSDFHLLNVFV